MKRSLSLGFRFAVVASLFIWSLAFLEKTEASDPSDYVVDETFNCTQNEFNCTSGECIPLDWACDAYSDCEDGSDEDDEMCRICNQPFLFQCDNGECISSQRRCDGYNNCEDYSDEYGCPPDTVVHKSAMNGQNKNR